MRHINKEQQGFTIIELILALAFFSFVLMFSIAGFVQIYRSYNKGLTVKRVHESGRLVIEDIARIIHSSAQTGVETGNVEVPGKRRFCAGGVRIAWNEINDSGVSRETFIGGKVINLSRTQSGACTDNIDPDLAESYLDSPDKNTDPNFVHGAVVVYDLNFTMIGSEAVRIELTLASSDPYGDLIDLIDASDPTTVTCKGSIVSGQQFCALVQLATTVSLRT